MTKKLLTYSNLIQIPDFLGRFNYLKLSGSVGEETFGWQRYINQSFYTSNEWRRFRNMILVRDGCCDLGIEGREIDSKPIIHHINPIGVDDILNVTDFLMNPEYVITVSYNTHQALHYGSSDLLMKDPVARTSGDTCPWR